MKNKLKSNRVLHLTSVHHAFDTRIFYKECKSLMDTGFEVILVAPHSYDEIVDGIKIRAIPKQSNRLKRMTYTLWQIFWIATKERACIYHFHDPELIIVGILLKLQGKRVIYDVHEDLPKQILSKYWIPRSLRRLVAEAARVAEALASRVFNGIVTATPAIGKRFALNKTVVVQNFPILDKLVALHPIPYQDRLAKVIYIGGISSIRGIREMVQAMSLVPNSLNAQLLLVGAFSPSSLEVEVRGIPGWEHIEFVGWQNRASVARLLGESRAGLVLFHPEPNHMAAQPNKLFEYMSAGLPVIASDFPLWRKIVEKEECGLLVNPLDPHSIAEAIQYLLTHTKEAEEMGKHGQRAVLERYNWYMEKDKLLSLYKRLG